MKTKNNIYTFMGACSLILFFFNSCNPDGGCVANDFNVVSTNGGWLNPPDDSISASDTRTEFSAKAVVVNPSNTHLYVMQDSPLAISIYVKDGLDTFESKQKLTDQSLGFTDLNDEYHMILDDDASMLFVTGKTSDSLVVFKVTTDGTLSIVRTITNTDTGIGGLDGAGAMHVKDDYLLVLGYESDSIAVFKQTSPSTIEQIQIIKNNTKDKNGVSITSLDGPRDITSVRRHAHVYVASQESDSITVFDWNSDDASPLTYSKAYSNGDEVEGDDQSKTQIVGLDGISSLQMAYTGRSFMKYPYYVTGNEDDNYVYVLYASSVVDNKITFFKIGKDGLLTQISLQGVREDQIAFDLEGIETLMANQTIVYSEILGLDDSGNVHSLVFNNSNDMITILRNDDYFGPESQIGQDLDLSHRRLDKQKFTDKDDLKVKGMVINIQDPYPNSKIDYLETIYFASERGVFFIERENAIKFGGVSCYSAKSGWRHSFD